MPRTLRLQPLTAEAFRPFGDVMDPPALGARPALGETLVARDGAVPVDRLRLEFGWVFVQRLARH